MNTNQQNPEFFPISECGPVYQLFKMLRINQDKTKLVIVILCISWLPLVIITAFEGSLYPIVPHSFLEDVAMQVRLLLGIPMLLLISSSIDSKVIEVGKYFSGTLMNDKEQQITLTRFMRGTRKLAGSAIAEIIMLLIVIVVTVSLGKGGIYKAFNGGTESWTLAVNQGGHVLSLAGKWADFISIPLYQFLLLRWLWRYVAWSVLLFRLSRTRMNLLATHPDKAAGLGIIVHAQKYFSLVFVTVSTVVSGELIAKLLGDPGSFLSIRSDGIGYIVICLFVLIFPMFFFTTKLIDTKEDGLLKLSKMGASLSSKFEEEWINDKPVENKTKEAIVSTSDLQDYDTIYVSLEELRYVPFTIKDIIGITLLLFIPYIPILFIHFSVGELLQKLFGLLA